MILACSYSAVHLSVHSTCVVLMYLYIRVEGIACCFFLNTSQFNPSNKTNKIRKAASYAFLHRYWPHRPLNAHRVWWSSSFATTQRSASRPSSQPSWSWFSRRTNLQSPNRHQRQSNLPHWTVPHRCCSIRYSDEWTPCASCAHRRCRRVRQRETIRRSSRQEPEQAMAPLQA